MMTAGPKCMGYRLSIEILPYTLFARANKTEGRIIMKNYLTMFKLKTQTPQNAPIPETTQIPNSAGGYSWAVDQWGRLRRFLVLGSEGGSYYASEQTLTLENANHVLKCIQACRTLRII